ncbi:class II aldolase/adducin family protein [Spirillospora sp. CA-294931]|uniref:class II aldolase/adducin family protein n=1 Tax=Spirillospora sp. CA-294931 TaxID=3240042 RepID=UPI003D8D48CE
MRGVVVVGELRRAVCEQARVVVELGLVLGTSGNVSVRRGDRVVVTPGGHPLDRLEPEMCPVLDLDGTVIEGELAPSSETPLHLGVYRGSAMEAVVHTHSVYGTAVATSLTALPPVHYNTMLLGGPIRVAPYATFGTPELAANVLAALDGRKGALMANHGAVALGHDLGEAVENARLLEWLCEVYVHARAIGEPRVLTREELEAARRRYSLT